MTTITPKPRSFHTVMQLSQLQPHSQIMLDATDHCTSIRAGLYTNPHPVSYYRHCQEPVWGLARTPVNEIVWDVISYVDFKLTPHTHPLQCQDLQRILFNSQPVRLLHLVVDAVTIHRACEFIQQLAFTNSVILDLHLVHAQEYIELQVPQLLALDLTRFVTVDYHYIINDQEAIYINLTGNQTLVFYNPEANRGHDGSINYDHMLRK